MIRTLVLALAVAACPAAAGAQSFASIFTQLPSDFRHLAQPSNLLILGSTGASSLALHPEDESIALKTKDPDQFYSAGDLLGQGAIHAAAGLAIYVGGRIGHNERAGQLGVDLLQGQIVSGLITNGLKFAANRTRPDGAKYSFPSGHTSSAFATASVLQRRFGWKVGVPSYVVASYVGASRVATSHHFVTDVLFGAGIGIAAGRATTFGLHGASVTVTPAITRNSATLNFTVGHLEP
jgi:membrane-associated phospholipid phosphatase